MGLKIAHLYWDTNGNWGDKVLGHATRGLIREFLDVDDITIFGTGPIPPDQRLDEINQHDVLFIGGGGMLM